MRNTRLSTVISYYNYRQQETIKTGNKSRSQGQPYSHILIMLIRHEYVNDNKWLTSNALCDEGIWESLRLVWEKLSYLMLVIQWSNLLVSMKFHGTVSECECSHWVYWRTAAVLHNHSFLLRVSFQIWKEAEVTQGCPALGVVLDGDMWSKTKAI